MSTSLGSQHFPQQNYIYKKEDNGEIHFLRGSSDKTESKKFLNEVRIRKGPNPIKVSEASTQALGTVTPCLSAYFPSLAPGKHGVPQVCPNFEDMPSLRRDAAAGVSKTMLIVSLIASSSLDSKQGEPS